MPSQKIIKPSPKQVTKLKNVTCPYCTLNLTEASSEDEHVIGRRFVPKGMLHGQWNLILKSCQKCNSKKSDLENDISAITLVGLAWFDDHDLDGSVLDEIKRKVKRSFSRKTKRNVYKSNEKFKVEFPSVSNLRIKFLATAPPQIEDTRSFELALMQVAAFFYFITYDNTSSNGNTWPESFYPLAVTHYRDWGNSTFKAFMETVENWKHRWLCITANGYHKSLIRKHPTKECWCWALEWNKNYRLIGFFGNQNAAQEILDSFPPVKKKIISNNDGTEIIYREEIKLNESDDILFKLKH